MRQEFTKKTMREAWDRCKEHCEGCGVKLTTGNIEYDHVIPCAMGGDNSLSNCQVICKKVCHRAKTFGVDIPRIAKTKRVSDLAKGIKKSKKPWPSRPFSQPKFDNTKYLDAEGKQS